MQPECIKCKAWDIAAKKNGYASGMCEECFNQSSVLVNLSYQPERSKREDLIDAIQNELTARHKLSEEIVKAQIGCGALNSMET